MKEKFIKYGLIIHRVLFGSMSARAAIIFLWLLVASLGFIYTIIHFSCYVGIFSSNSCNMYKFNIPYGVMDKFGLDYFQHYFLFFSSIIIFRLFHMKHIKDIKLWTKKAYFFVFIIIYAELNWNLSNNFEAISSLLIESKTTNELFYHESFDCCEHKIKIGFLSLNTGDKETSLCKYYNFDAIYIKKIPKKCKISYREAFDD